MSRILRRPMFRGGPINSRGTGITAPLVPGYKGGGQIGGGIIYGIPGADGRYGFKQPMMYNSLEEILKIIPQNMTGQQIKDQYKINFPINEYSTFIAENPQAGNISETAEGDIFYTGGKPEYDKQPKYSLGEGDTQGTLPEGIDKVEKTTETDALGNPIYTGTTVKKEKVEVPANPLLNINKGNDAELNEEEIKELLGSKKAFGKDVGDELGYFAGAEGKTVMEKLNNYFKKSSEAGPSRTEKIDDTYAKIVIKDKMDARSDRRKIDLLKANIDYKVKAGKELNIAEGILAATKGQATTDKRLIQGIQASTSPITGKNYVFAKITTQAQLKSDLKNNKYRPGDTFIVKTTTTDENNNPVEQKSIIELDANGVPQLIYKI